MADYTKPVYDKLHKNDCIFVRRGKGDHNVYYSPITNRTFGVDGKITKRHSADSIMKLAGIKHKF